MGRRATKAVDNVWYKARMEAAKWNEKLYSRAGAAEAINMSEDAIKDTELGIEKCMSVDKAVLLSDLYNAPQLLNHYCMHECPIGCNMELEEEVPTIEQATVRLMKGLKVEELQDVKNRLLDIAEDGVVGDDEIADLRDIAVYLSGLSKTISGIQLILHKEEG